MSVATAGLEKVGPMFADPIDEIPEGAGESGSRWVVEPKLDGWRCIAYVGDGEVVLTTRSGNRITSLPYIEAALAPLPAGTVLDGEVVDLDGPTQFNRAASICAWEKYQHRPAEDDPPLTFVAFDALRIEGTDLRGETLETRQDFLPLLLLDTDGQPNNRCVRVIEKIGSVEDALDHIVGRGFEGVVVKDRDSTYVADDRTRWFKYKPHHEVEAVCTGVYDPKDDSQYSGKAVGGITFRVEHADGRVYDGRCAGKMDNKLRARLYREPEQFVGLVVEIGHWGVGAEGALRHPSFHRFRDPKDKPAPRAATARVVRAASSAKKMRNYGAMLDPKLLRCRDELAAGEGAAVDRCGAENVARDLAKVEDLVAERGL